MESIKQEIEKFGGEKIVEMTEVYVYKGDWTEHMDGAHISEVDGNDCWDSEVSSWNDEGHSAEIVVVIETPDKPILLRQVGIKDKNGNAYHDLDAWLPENAFGKGIWSENEKIAMLRAKFHDIWKDKVSYIGVRYEIEEH